MLGPCSRYVKRVSPQRPWEMVSNQFESPSRFVYLCVRVKCVKMLLVLLVASALHHSGTETASP